MQWRPAPVATLVTLSLGACQTDGVGPATGEVEVAFRTVPSLQIGGGPAPSSTVTGPNGTLRIDRMLMVVAEFELEGTDGACLEDDDDDDGGADLPDCRSFESEPFLLELALDGSAVSVVKEDVGTGSFSELEFEIEDLELDDDDDAADEIAARRAIVRNRISDWPDGASMYVQGAFTPAGGTPRAFRVFVDAEVELEMELDPLLVVGQDRTARITIVTDPARWFRLGGGNVLDLSSFDFGDGGRLLDLEVRLKDGFSEIEVELDG